MTLNIGEKPREPNPTKLSQILETEADPKYRLSSRACRGILNRAERRGKELPRELKEALEEQIREAGAAEPEVQSQPAVQSVSKNEPESLGGGKGILIQGERTGALSTLNNQSVLQESMGPTECESVR